ncbi:MAG: Holliday junction resolvase RuvX [Saprospiraceae bacterium]|nr:Holliday junction resolvase RuvX [Saprospiraceae bacterium]
MASNSTSAGANYGGGSMSGRILAVDPGEKRIGIAVSDPTGTIANPLTVINHKARAVDAARIVQIAQENKVTKIIVGCPFDMEGEMGPQARKSARIAEAIRTQTNLPVELWDESGSTQEARAARILLGVRKSKRTGHMDDLAATYILQTYLDSISS